MLYFEIIILLVISTLYIKCLIFEFAVAKVVRAL